MTDYLSKKMLDYFEYTCVTAMGIKMGDEENQEGDEAQKAATAQRKADDARKLNNLREFIAFFGEKQKEIQLINDRIDPVYKRYYDRVKGQRGGSEATDEKNQIDAAKARVKELEDAIKTQSDDLIKDEDFANSIWGKGQFTAELNTLAAAYRRVSKMDNVANSASSLNKEELARRRQAQLLTNCLKLMTNDDKDGLNYIDTYVNDLGAFCDHIGDAVDDNAALGMTPNTVDDLAARQNSDAGRQAKFEGYEEPIISEFGHKALNVVLSKTGAGFVARQIRRGYNQGAAMTPDTATHNFNEACANAHKAKTKWVRDCLPLSRHMHDYIKAMTPATRETLYQMLEYRGNTVSSVNNFDFYALSSDEKEYIADFAKLSKEMGQEEAVEHVKAVINNRRLLLRKNVISTLKSVAKRGAESYYSQIINGAFFVKKAIDVRQKILTQIAKLAGGEGQTEVNHFLNQKFYVLERRGSLENVVGMYSDVDFLYQMVNQRLNPRSFEHGAGIVDKIANAHLLGQDRRPLGLWQIKQDSITASENFEYNRTTSQFWQRLQNTVRRFLIHFQNTFPFINVGGKMATAEELEGNVLSNLTDSCKNMMIFSEVAKNVKESDPEPFLAYINQYLQIRSFVDAHNDMIISQNKDNYTLTEKAWNTLYQAHPMFGQAGLKISEPPTWRQVVDVFEKFSREKRNFHRMRPFTDAFPYLNTRDSPHPCYDPSQTATTNIIAVAKTITFGEQTQEHKTDGAKPTFKEFHGFVILPNMLQMYRMRDELVKAKAWKDGEGAALWATHQNASIEDIQRHDTLEDDQKKHIVNLLAAEKLTVKDNQPLFDLDCSLTHDEFKEIKEFKLTAGQIFETYGRQKYREFQTALAREEDNFFPEGSTLNAVIYNEMKNSGLDVVGLMASKKYSAANVKDFQYAREKENAKLNNYLIENNCFVRDVHNNPRISPDKENTFVPSYERVSPEMWEEVFDIMGEAKPDLKGNTTALKNINNPFLATYNNPSVPPLPINSGIKVGSASHYARAGENNLPGIERYVEIGGSNQDATMFSGEYGTDFSVSGRNLEGGVPGTMAIKQGQIHWTVHNGSRVHTYNCAAIYNKAKNKDARKELGLEDVKNHDIEKSGWVLKQFFSTEKGTEHIVDAWNNFGKTLRRNMTDVIEGTNKVLESSIEGGTHTFSRTGTVMDRMKPKQDAPKVCPDKEPFSIKIFSRTILKLPFIYLNKPKDRPTMQNPLTVFKKWYDGYMRNTSQHFLYGLMSRLSMQGKSTSVEQQDRLQAGTKVVDRLEGRIHEDGKKPLPIVEAINVMSRLEYNLEDNIVNESFDPIFLDSGEAGSNMGFNNYIKQKELVH